MTMDVGARLMKLRTEKGFTKYRMAEITGISHTHIGNIENGSKVPNIDTLSRLLEPLGVSLSEFFAEDDSLFCLTPQEQEFMKLLRTLPPDKADMMLQFIKKFSE